MSIPYIDDEMYPWKGSIEQLLNYWQPGFGNGISSFGVARARLNDVADDYGLPPIEEGSAAVARERINALIDGSGIPEGARMFSDFKTGRYYGGAPTVSRAGEVLMLGPDGYQAFPANTLARIDGVGAQVAPARVNLAPQSETFTAAVGIATLTKSQSAPDGTNNGTLVVEAATTGEHHFDDVTYSVTAGQVYTWSTFVKAAPSSRLIRLRFAGVSTATAFFDPVAGAWAGSPSGTDSRGFEALPNGWYRVWMTATMGSSGSLVARLQMAINATTVNYAGDGVSGYICWGRQLELGSFASPPIITSGAAVSRPGDILSDSVPDGGRAFALAIDIKDRDASGRYLAQWFDGSTGNRYTLCINTAGTAFSLDVGSGGSFVGGTSFLSNGPIIGRHFISGVARGGYVYAADLGAAEPSPSNVIAPLNINRLGLGGNGINTANNSFSVIEKFCEADVLNFASSDEARAWAKSIAQGWA